MMDEQRTPMESDILYLHNLSKHFGTWFVVFILTYFEWYMNCIMQTLHFCAYF